MRRIAILGGGMAGLTAAWSLSTAACRDELEVTIYQRGWRLGGIEEHGLHVWLGWYENAFHLIRQVYEELDRPVSDPACPIATWRDAFAPADRLGQDGRSGGSWLQGVAAFARSDGEPGDGEPGEGEEIWQIQFVATFVRRGLGLLLNYFAGNQRRQTSPEPAGIALSSSPTSGPPPAAPPSMADFMVLLRQAEIGALLGTVEAIRLLRATTPTRDSPAALVVESLERMREDIDATAGPDDARRLEALADSVITCIQGVVRNGLLSDPAGFDALDHLDFRDWMAANGAAKETLESPLVRGIYDLVSAYEDGDPARPRLSAGLGLLLTGKLLFDSRVSMVWAMRAGMGDVVFAPMYQALRARGVRFAFFHRVDRLQLSSDGGSIGAVTLGRQARLAGGRSEYEPLVRVREVPCFPSAPRIEQLAGTVRHDLESHWSDQAAEEEVRLVAGEDFDDLVLAISLGMVPHVCGKPADQSGCDNLYLAGAWTDSAVNVGSIEAAVMAGIQAANGVRRRPLTEGLVGAWRGPWVT